MLRRVVAIVLMLCLHWQGLAASGAGVALAEATEQAHELLHFEGTAHHHDDHEDGFHLDDSPSSAIHLAADAGQFSPALIGLPAVLVMAVGPARPVDDAVPFRTFPPPDGLERPPRRTA